MASSTAAPDLHSALVLHGCTMNICFWREGSLQSEAWRALADRATSKHAAHVFGHKHSCPFTAHIITKTLQQTKQSSQNAKQRKVGNFMDLLQIELDTDLYTTWSTSGVPCFMTAACEHGSMLILTMTSHYQSLQTFHVTQDNLVRSSCEMEACVNECKDIGPPLTLYSTLGVGIQASAEVIRSAYRRLARLWHPDRHRGDDFAKRKFQEVQGAYEVLIDQERRYEYDLNLLGFLDVEEYLSRYRGLILTACGLDMSSRYKPHGTHPNITIDTDYSSPDCDSGLDSEGMDDSQQGSESGHSPHDEDTFHHVMSSIPSPNAA